MTIKINGPRSIQTKLERLSAEFREDAARILRETPQHASMADTLQFLSRKLGVAALQAEHT